MAKIIEYTVIHHVEKAEFIRLAQEAVDNGWEPQGGICFDFAGGNPSMGQAFVKYQGSEEWDKIAKSLG